MSIRKVYVSAPYTAPTPEQVQAHVDAATAVGLQVRAAGFVPVVPHIAIVPSPDLTWDLAMDECLALLADCHACLMIGDWHHSKGARAELAFSEGSGIPVFYNLADLCVSLEARP
ncbi:MAG: DUF4406 domain-containing protein [Betaproteobacteria bacterium]